MWENGLIVPWRDATIHSLSHGLHYGGSVFEGERAYSGNIFLKTEHSERLLHSGEQIGMAIPYSVQELDDAKEQILKKNNLTNAYVRAFAWRGSDQLGLSAQGLTTNVAIACWEWPNYYGGDAISLQTARWRAPHPDTAPTSSKTGGLYPIHSMSKDEAVANGYTDGLMLDYRGLVAEASAANIFMVKDGEIKTPVPHCFLNGLTRQTIIKIAMRDGMKIVECDITPDELLTADEIFLTGTAAEITPVGKIDNTTFTVGPVTKHMQDAYSKLVNSPVEEQNLRNAYPYDALKKTP